MPMDPRLAAVTAMSKDPNVQLAQRVKDLERRLEALDRGGRRTYVGAGAPTQVVPDGALYVDTVGIRLYVRVGGAWKSTVVA